jgi:drug/metabolite transporter (DMT)-like permease
MRHRYRSTVRCGMPTSNLRGILSMIAAVGTFAVMDVTMKRLVEAYPAVQVTFLRGAASLPFLLLAATLFGNWRDLIPRHWQLHLLRGVLSVATLWLFVYSLRELSLADAYSIFMCTPLLVTAISVPLLGDRVGWRRWVAVLVGLVGVIVLLKPSGAGLLTLGALAALASAAAYALSVVTIRLLSRTDTGSATILWTLVLLTVLSGAIATPTWVQLDLAHWPWIVALGLSGAVGQYFITEAFRRAPPSVVAPFEYTALAWGVLFDWLLWARTPGARMLVGASIIIASGLYVIHRERLTRTAPS